jgi:hypothetical protein
MIFFLRLFKRLAALLLVGSLTACSLEPEVVTLPDLAPMTGDAPMFRLGPDNLPLLPPVVRQLKYEYYQCDTLFSSRKEANDCVVNSRCTVARNVTLVPREGAVWRSYFLTDFELKKYYTHCMAPRQQWHKLITCDGVVPKA